ncbi:MAG: type IV-A pilus assembly ATPase PilB [Acidobacteria bacterium]|nr:MAG: type IV-A pilus assembly ATPase PilB [Acidobacteriota bacterium]TDI48285.1 MAG: type IV-A pilus assembly ATPase PilB [Acidobacteriota bacterium]
MALKLGWMLVNGNIVTEAQLQETLEYQKKSGGKLGFNLVKLGFCTEEDITQFLSQQYGVPSVNLRHFEIVEDVAKLMPAEVAQKYLIMPLSRNGATLTLAMVDPTNVFAMDDIKFMTGYNVEPVVASEMAIKEAIEKHYGSSHTLELKKVMDEMAASSNDELEVLDEDEELDLRTLEEASEEAPVVKLVNIILTDAIKRSASDIHIEPYEKDFRVRFRIDGVLYEIMHPPLKLRDAILSRLKIMAKLDISEKRLPQDGRIKIKMKMGGKNREMDFRVSVLPTLYGEKIVLRLLDKDNLVLDMRKLGFEEESLEKFERAIFRPYGMVLVTGPTGSGKTNTLYSAISTVNTPETNIMTAEDPVEFNLHGINQVQMKESIGLTFAAALRSFLRQDPNIVLVGEIRDFETAEIAVKAALTGHLVLSTLHTNDAPSTINRLMNMGIEPFLVATSVHLICAQRLVRRVCRECKEPFSMPAQAMKDIGFREEDLGAIKLYKGAGCQTCNNTGYKGRVGLYEVMEIGDGLRELILCGASSLELKSKAEEDGMISLRHSGLHKIKDGITTVEEVVRETVL